MKKLDNILKVLEEFRRNLIDELRLINRDIRNIQSRDSIISDQADTIKRQNKIIDDLINNIYTQDTSLEAVMIKPYRKAPKIFKNGKRLDSENMTSFDIDWNYDSRIDISVRNE